MRALVPAAILLLALLPAVADGHSVRACAPERSFPSAAGWQIVPGRTLSFWLPPDYYAAILAVDPIDVTLYTEPLCGLDPTCHKHAESGLLTCATRVDATIEIHNGGDTTALVFGAIGQCHVPGAPC